MIMKRILPSAFAILLSLALIVTARAAPASFRVAPFEADITIPIGHACMGGGVADAKEIVDPLYAKGFALLGAGKPIVVVDLADTLTYLGFKARAAA